MQRKKVIVLSVQMEGESWLIHARAEGKESIVLELGPAEARMLHLALSPSIRSATLQSLGQEIAAMLSVDSPVEVPFG